MASSVEHASISVTDMDEALRFFRTAMPDFQVRYDSGLGPDRWVHFGSDTTYIAIRQMPPPAEVEYHHQRPGFNHVGFVVDDADELHERMQAAGYREGFVPTPHPYRKRVYFLDNDGMEYEFVEYYSKKAGERNDYSL